MTPEQMRGLLPTPEVLSGWGVVEDAREWVGLDQDLMSDFLDILGSRMLTSLPLLAGLDPVVVRRAIEDVRRAFAEVAEGDTPPPREATPLERVQLGLFFNAARAKFGLPPVDVVFELGAAPTGAGQTPPGLAAGTSLPPNPLHKVKLSSVLDQVSDAEVQLLPADVIAEKRQNYRSITGGDPLERCNFTDAQLSALSQKVSGGGVPYADFAVWGPYGSRIEKRMKFRSSFLDVGGEWKTIEVPGPASFEVWEECWEVFQAAAIADGLASQATLAMYAAEFKSRVRDFGVGCWQLCVEADVIARSEQFVLEHSKQLALYSANPKSSPFDPNRPWESVIRAVALDRGFWDRVLEKPALRRELQGGGRATPAFQQQQGEEPESSNKRAAPPPKGNPKKRAKGGKGGGANPADQRRKDGRFYRGRNGKELCFKWGREEKGCSEPCSQGRMHACEWCRQPHRSIHCPTHPNWKPGDPSK